MNGYLVGQRTLALWWNTGIHAGSEEPQSVELAAARFGMGATRRFVASLSSTYDFGGALQATVAVFGVKPQRADQRVGGVADLAQRDQRVFPPAVARSDARGKVDSPS